MDTPSPTPASSDSRAAAFAQALEASFSKPPAAAAPAQPPPASAPAPLPPPSRYLRMEEMAPFRHAFFESRRKVSGRFTGRHASPKRGSAAEFSDYRPYTPGDEPKDVDWKAFARSDRLVVRLSEQPSDMPVMLVVDGSASMAFSGVEGAGVLGAKAKPTKYDHAAKLAAAIAFLALRQQDHAGLSVAQGAGGARVKTRGGLPHLHAVLAALEKTRPAGKALLARSIEAAVLATRSRGVLVLVSDLWEDRAGVLKALDLARHRGHQAMVFHVLHAEELALPDRAEMMLMDPESDAEIRVNFDDIRASYQAKLRAHIDGWRHDLALRQADHVLVSTATPWQESLRGYLVAQSGLPGGQAAGHGGGGGA